MYWAQKISALFVCLLLLAGTLPADPIIRLKRRSLQTSGDLQAHRIGPLKRRHANSSHYLIQFSAPPSRVEINELRRRGVIVTSYVPDAALVVAAADETSWDDLGITYVGRLDELDKLSAELSSEEAASFVVVEFHPDVDMAEARSLIRERSLRINERENMLPNQILADGPTEAILRLAEWDEVAYVFPASPELINGDPVVACPGAIIEDGPIAQYVKVGPGWPRTGAAGSAVALNYFLGQLTSKIPTATAQAEIVRALSQWTATANLTITPGASATGPRTINIFFASGAHGDPYPFDGPGKVLGHTFYPPPNSEPIAGDMHLDADETWHTGSSIDLFSVALHEAGHALGLAHSDKPGAVMYPFYKLSTGLSADDIAGIQDLYGAAQQTPPSGTPPPPMPEPAPAPSLAITSPSANLTTTATAITMAGTTSGGSGALRVTWVNDRGASGVASGSSSWTIASMPLASGVNNVTVTVTDASNRTASQTITITRSIPATADTTAPSLTIQSPVATIVSTYSASIGFSGIAADNVGVVSVTWSNTFGNAGVATGTVSWQIPVVPLLVGTNKITVRAIDAAGNTGWRMVTVVRR